MSVVGPRYLPITIELGEDARNARSVYGEFNVSNTQFLHPRTEAETNPNRGSCKRARTQVLPSCISLDLEL